MATDGQLGVRGRFPDLYELLALQPRARLDQIAEAWGGPARSPGEVCTLMLADDERFREIVREQQWSDRTRLALEDVVQDFGMPVLFYPDDRQARLDLSNLGLIYPYPQQWGGVAPKQSQRAWTMPVEVAILCAQVIPVYRPRLPLMLGMLPPGEVVAIGQMYGLNLRASDYAAAVLQLATYLLEGQTLVELLLDPEFQEELFALQIVFEWHGICHRQELFSFAWGDDTVKPLMAPEIQTRERRVERDLKGHGLLYAYRPPESGETDKPVEGAAAGASCSFDPDALDPRSALMLVLPEELRPIVWSVGRQLQEEATANLIAGLGGWSASPEVGNRPTLEPCDRLKAVGCLLDGPAAVGTYAQLADTLAALDGEPSLDATAWRGLLEVATLAGVLAEPSAAAPLHLARGGAEVLDEGPEAFGTRVLTLWVEGQGPESVDGAQNRALGLDDGWRKTVRPLLRGTHVRVPALEPWWQIVSDASGPMATEPDGPRRPRRYRRPVPSWLKAPSLESDLDITCGCPRPTPDQQTLLDEFQLVEGVVTTLRLLILDVLSGLSTEGPILFSELSVLLQEVTALAIHLNLAVMLLDATGQTFIPLHPPTVVTEGTSDTHFDHWAATLVSDLLEPAGAVVVEGDSVRVLASRCIVETPKWVDQGGRLGALSSLVGLELDVTRPRSRRSALRLRAVSMARPEAEGRFWLGRPFEDLRRVVAGRMVTALANGFIEVSPPTG